MKLRFIPPHPDEPLEPPLDPSPPLDLDALALAWGRELLAARAATGRFRLELFRASCPYSPRAQRHRYRAQLRIWEPLARMIVALDRAGEPTRVHAALDDDDEAVAALALPPADARTTERAARAALTAARARALPDEALRARSVRVLRGAGAGGRVLVEVERAARDGVAVLHLEPLDGSRLAWFVAPLLRGSRRCAAFSRVSAVARAAAQVELPDGARLARARLVTTTSASGGLVRCWRLRWDGPEGERLAACLNARTGALAGATRTSSASDDPAVRRAEAEADLKLVVRMRLGPNARTSVLVAGTTPGSAPRAVWLAVIATPDGPLRATIDGGQVLLSGPSGQEAPRGLDLGELDADAPDDADRASVA